MHSGISMVGRMPAGNANQSQKDDPRRPNKIFRYKPLPNKPTDDPTPDYMNLLGMIFSMCGLMMRVSSMFRTLWLFASVRYGFAAVSKPSSFAPVTTKSSRYKSK